MPSSNKQTLPTCGSRRQAGLYSLRSGGRRGEEKEQEKEQEKVEENPQNAANAGATDEEDQGEDHGASAGEKDERSESGSDDEEDSEEDEVRKKIAKTYEEDSESESESELEEVTEVTGTANAGGFVDMGGGIGVTFNPEDSQEWEEGGEEEQAPPLDNPATNATEATTNAGNNQGDDAGSATAAAVVTLETLNPEDPNYKEPPRQPDDKGPFQLWMENKQNIPTGVSEHQLILGAVGTLLGFYPHDFKPYSSHQEISVRRKGRGLWKSMKPNKKGLLLEIKRRNKEFKPNYQNSTATDYWNELAGGHMAYLTDEDVRYIKLQERVMRGQTESLVLAELGGSAIAGKTERQVRRDRMRFICCFQDDRIVEAYKLSQISMTRTELDGRNSASRNSNFYDLVVAKFNDTNWVAKSKAIPTLNEDFVEEHEFPKREDFTLDTHKAKTILGWERSQIMIVLRKYQESGRGSTNVAEKYQLGDMTDDEIHTKWGHFDSELAETEGGDDRQDYLHGAPTDILYWWAILDELDIIQATCVVFKKIYGASSMETPVPIAELDRQAKSSRKAKKNEASEALAKQISGMQEELASMNRNRTEARKERTEARLEAGVKRTKAALEELEKERLTVQEKLYTQSDGAPQKFKDALEGRIKSLEDKINDEEEYLSQLQKRLKTE